MEKKIFDINDALVLLKNGLVVVDVNKSRFKLIKENIIVKNDNARYSLNEIEFLKLYKDSKFVILEDDGAVIDSKKDDEYYGFKHK